MRLSPGLTPMVVLHRLPTGPPSTASAYVEVMPVPRVRGCWCNCEFPERRRAQCQVPGAHRLLVSVLHLLLLGDLQGHIGARRGSAYRTREPGMPVGAKEPLRRQSLSGFQQRWPKGYPTRNSSGIVSRPGGREPRPPTAGLCSDREGYCLRSRSVDCAWEE